MHQCQLYESLSFGAKSLPECCPRSFLVKGDPHLPCLRKQVHEVPVTTCSCFACINYIKVALTRRDRTHYIVAHPHTMKRWETLVTVILASEAMGDQRPKIG